jgi:hypothetical protein
VATTGNVTATGSSDALASRLRCQFVFSFGAGLAVGELETVHERPKAIALFMCGAELGLEGFLASRAVLAERVAPWVNGTGHLRTPRLNLLRQGGRLALACVA